MAATPSGQAVPNTNQHQAGPATRNQRQRKPHPAQAHHLTDGALSDSVLNHTSSPKKTPKHRHHDAASGPSAHAPHPNGYPQNHRPTSLAGPTIHPATPTKEAAYAGPTFQASPAPSSLPVPKFFSRSVPNVAAQSSLTARMGQETASDDPEDRQPTPEPDVVGIPRDGHKSPLDFFFNADRQEKEKSLSLSGLSPEMARKREVPRVDSNGNFPNATIHYASSSQRLSQPSSRPPFSPETSTTPPAAGPSAERDAQTAALKALLFNNINNASAPSQSPPPAQSRPLPDQSPARQHHPSPPSHTLGRAQNTPSPSQARSTSGPSTPTPLSEHERADGYYAPHYGNQRNLSPLFKAASSTKSGTVPGSRGPSGLRRQETASDDSPPLDPNSFSRGYLEQHLRASPSPLNVPFANGRHQHQQAHPSAASTYANSPMTSHANAAPSGSESSPRASKPADQGGNGTRDIKGMEDDLRRMLNLNVLNN
ncbi:hypothetical protein BDY17DRAFT_295698 [Neohortaea acidophila]|uniref:Proteophosphoglycan 5 n=1 Tax=Neohortaea acidophila TaxID=245834 RepID=A0A6A6PXL0_9PEZI|nr:uncharacterized protein BDY17DRAFT_295698 [Neohortaea acidophila]KAF2484474.1 hypothetical protein BDY17DRAFT_295698 [Neohortaea acidophila]